MEFDSFFCFFLSSSNSSNSIHAKKTNHRKLSDGGSDGDYRQRARQLIQKTKQHQSSSSTTYEDFNSLTSSPSTISTVSSGVAHKPETIQLAKQLIADAKKRKFLLQPFIEFWAFCKNDAPEKS
jgi:hypothetical protein